MDILYKFVGIWSKYVEQLLEIVENLDKLVKKTVEIGRIVFFLIIWLKLIEIAIICHKFDMIFHKFAIKIAQNRKHTFVSRCLQIFYGKSALFEGDQ